MSARSERLRVLWLIKGLGPGGAEQLLVSAARVADHERFAYETAYLLPHKATLADPLRRAGVVVHCLDAADPRRPAWLVRLRRLLLDRRYDVVHLHSPLVAGLARTVIETLPRPARPAVVSTEHNTWGDYATATRLVNAALYRRDAHHFAVSGRVRASIPPRYRADTEVLMHGIVLRDAAATSPAADATLRRSLGVTDNTVMVTTVANFRTQKAYPDLLEAAGIAVAADPRIKFFAIGQGPLLEDIRSLRDRMGLRDSFTLLGYRQDALDLVRVSDLFVLASRYEGFPVAVMEALAVGCPLVCTSVGGVPDVVEDGVHGRIVPPGAPRQLAAGIVELAASTERRQQMSANARSVGERFDIKRTVQRLEAVYARLGEAHAGP